jgi:hypothetical protein
MQASRRLAQVWDLMGGKDGSKKSKVNLQPKQRGAARAASRRGCGAQRCAALLQT